MSKTTIPPKETVEVWLRAGGRCEYPNCNQPLWKDELTLTKMNRAYLAHIVADSAEGPRGDPVQSEQLKKDPSNIMLLCDTHHRLVDRVDVAGHPVDLLRQYKVDHEERIERQTGIQANQRTEILLFGTRIGDRQGRVNYDQARGAVLPERYPASETGIRIDLADVHLTEVDPTFWEMATTHVERSLALYIETGKGPTGRPINHLSVFALAPIPLLIHFGKQLGDIVSADVYQRQRSNEDWCWHELEDEGFDFRLFRPDPIEHKATKIAINLSLSGTIHQTEIDRALGERAPTYTMNIAHPQRDFLRSKEQLELFRNEWNRMLSEVRMSHSEECEIHLFSAVPNSVAVEIGRALLPKSDPRIVVYDHNRERNGFVKTISL